MATAQEILNKRNTIQNQMNEANVATTGNEALRYLSDQMGNFKPLQEERRSLQAQAGNVLPTQIQEYTQSRQANPGGSASPLTMLGSMMRNQNNLRATSDLVGDQINSAQGRLSNISNDALGILKQNQDNLLNQFKITNSDFERQTQVEEQAKARARAQSQARARAAQQRASMLSAQSQFGSGGSGGFSVTIPDSQPQAQNQKAKEPWNPWNIGADVGNSVITNPFNTWMGEENLKTARATADIFLKRPVKRFFGMK